MGYCSFQTENNGGPYRNSKKGTMGTKKDLEGFQKRINLALGIPKNARIGAFLRGSYSFFKAFLRGSYPFSIAFFRDSYLF